MLTEKPKRQYIVLMYSPRSSILVRQLVPNRASMHVFLPVMSSQAPLGFDASLVDVLRVSLTVWCFLDVLRSRVTGKAGILHVRRIFENVSRIYGCCCWPWPLAEALLTVPPLWTYSALCLQLVPNFLGGDMCHPSPRICIDCLKSLCLGESVSFSFAHISGTHTLWEEL